MFVYGTLIIALLPIVFTNSHEIASRRIYLSHPEEVGSGHTHIVQGVERRLDNSKKKSVTTHQFYNAIEEELKESLCNQEDSACHRSMLDIVSEVFSTTSSRPAIPEHYDPRIAEVIDNLFSSFSTFDVEPKEKVIAKMSDDLETLKNMDAPEAQKNVGIITYSVAIESFKQWHEVLHDSTSSFHAIRGLDISGRDLQIFGGNDNDDEEDGGNGIFGGDGILGGNNNDDEGEDGDGGGNGIFGGDGILGGNNDDEEDGGGSGILGGDSEDGGVGEFTSNAIERLITADVESAFEKG